MQGVNVFENGIGYLFKCLNLYTSGTGFFVMYLFCLAYVFIKGSTKVREMFIPNAVVLMITVYNPFVPIVLDRIFDVSSEYYRLFWIAPVIILVPYVLTTVIMDEKCTSRKVLYAILTAAMFILGGNFVYSGGHAAQNIYKIDDELIEISDLIHEDSGTEYTRAFFEYGYNMEIRQYDPKMLLAIDREQYLYAVNYSYTDEMLSDDGMPEYKILAVLVRNQNVDEGDFTDALIKTATPYVVLTKGHPQTSYVRSAGLREIGQTGTHTVFKLDGAVGDYGLVDYTGAEHRFSFRRLK
ncbi:MAG: hypothetical protein K6G58_05975 [Lachnospiraceae bacterium]|nr:hypothetical protein [Lachnospiraceae bacterium]